jgi:hypothetical protein
LKEIKDQLGKKIIEIIWRFFFLKALRCNSVDKLQGRLDKKKDPKTGLRKFS